MSSTGYSFFNFNNYDPNTYSFNNNNFEFRRFPLYAVNNIPIITYFLIGVTAVTLGYVTLTEKNTDTDGEPIQGGERGSKDIKNKKNKSKRKYIHNTK
jgi:hypothetical protein